ncbi:MAG: acyl-CoA thioesterase [Gammaproteobacteria bacterium]|nr:acyl-CoA thioesterase [Gammaproteobacteria bacterium]
MSKATALIGASVNIRVPFHDVDVMEVAWHGHYVKYFEIARCALLDKIDYNYAQMRESGYAWPVIDLHIRYAQAAYFGQEITVLAEIVEWENRLKINYLVTSLTKQQRLTRGHTIQVAVDVSKKEMCFVSPRILFEKLGVPYE